MNNETNFNDKDLTKSKKIRKIILGGVALAVVLAGVGTYAIINSNPKTRVLKALKATSDELNKKETFIDKIAGKDFINGLEGKAIRQNMQFNVKSGGSTDLAKLNDFGISIDTSLDQKNKKLSFDMGAKYKGTDIANAQFYTDNQKLMLCVPKVYGSWLSIDSENIQDQYNNSVLASGRKLPNNEITMKLFGDDNDPVLLGNDLYKAVIEGYLNENKEKFITMGKNIKVEKAKDSKSIEIAGKSEECTGYNVTISSQDLKDLFESAGNYILEDKEIKKSLTNEAKYTYMDKYSSPEEMVKDMYKDMENNINKIKDSVKFNDVNAVIYVDKKGRAVGMEINTTLDSNGKSVSIKYSGDLKGKDNISDIVKASLELEANAEKVTVDLDSNTTNQDDTIKTQTNVVLKSNNSPIKLDINSEGNTKNGDFNASAVLSSKGQGLNAYCNGNASFDKSNNELKFDLKKIDFTANGGYKPITVSLDGSYAISSLENSISEPTGDKKELFKLSQQEILQIAHEVQKNYSQLESAFKR